MSPTGSDDGRLARIEHQVTEINSALRGAFGGRGIVQQMSDLQGQVGKLESERAYAKGMVAILAVVCSVAMSIAARLLGI